MGDNFLNFIAKHGHMDIFIEKNNSHVCLL